MLPRHPTSTAQLESRIKQMATSPLGLTWRRLHDAVATDDRVRAREALYGLALRGQLHQRQHGRQTHFFATAELAAAWVPPPDCNKPPGAKKLPAPQVSAEPQPILYTRIDGYTHDPRYQLGPRQQPPALFSSLGMGRYPDD